MTIKFYICNSKSMPAYVSHFSNRNVRVTWSANLYLHVLNRTVIFFGSNQLILYRFQNNNPSLSRIVWVSNVLSSHTMSENSSLTRFGTLPTGKYLPTFRSIQYYYKCEIREGWICSTDDETGNYCIIWRGNLLEVAVWNIVRIWEH